MEITTQGGTMNANTALKINDAIDQAIRCGEGRDAVQAQVERAIAQAERQLAKDPRTDKEARAQDRLLRD